MARTPRTANAPKVVGEVVSCPLSDVKPNGWNPNQMTTAEMKSLAHGLKKDGWMASMALLIWGTDETGETKNLIIDGEQRWTAAPMAGFKEGPMVFLHGVTESEAKALTIKLDQKRGKFNKGKLTDLMAELKNELGLDLPDMALDFGFTAPDLTDMLHLSVDMGDVHVSGNDETPIPPLKKDEPEAEPEKPSLSTEKVELKGIQPNLRIPVVFYASEEQAGKLRLLFATEKKHELNTDLLIRMCDKHFK